MRRKVSCCYNCPDRKLHCHSESEKYKTECEQYYKEKAEVVKQHNMDAAITNTMIEGGRRMKEKKRRK